MRKTYSTSKYLHKRNRMREMWLRDQLTLEKESSPLLLEFGLDSALQRYNTGCGESRPVNQCTLNSHYWSDKWDLEMKWQLWQLPPIPHVFHCHKPSYITIQSRHVLSKMVKTLFNKIEIDDLYYSMC